jgi:hypothetical protein
MTGFRDKQYLPHSLHKITSDFYNLTQGKHLSNQEYYDEFNSMVDTAEDSGATIGAHPAGVTAILNVLALDSDAPTTPERVASVQMATQRYLAVAFILGADKMVAEAYDYLCNYKKDPKNLSRLLGNNAGGDSLNTGVAFMQNGGKGDYPPNTTHEQAFATAGGTGIAQNHKKVC